ncbi:MAG: hypothetical protein A3K68_01405 [Euryarchaeota archaeon RBG_16_68_13]|nr:MAG: hypothetical protein A3K68_01405 [Euryarchaeota archaeon RBG_16_68_13]
MPDDSDSVAQIQAALDRGDADGARALAREAYARDPSDGKVRELYVPLHLAQAIRLAAEAREARRRDIARRRIPYDEDFEDTPEVARAFEAALEAHEAILRADPGNEKVLMMKAVLLFRKDREKGRTEALGILRAIRDSRPENRQVAFAIRKVERPCERCSDTGFCPRCAGRGFRSLLRIERACDACHGQGICPVCGIL